jgi:hypothetical protein
MNLILCAALGFGKASSANKCTKVGSEAQMLVEMVAREKS